jgi:iron(III) transport system substrate-binding protein
MRKALCAIIVFGIAFLVSCQRQPDERQTKVVVYCSVDQTVAEPILAAFEKRSGIKVLARFDTEASKTVGLVQRIRAEAAEPAADVFWSGEVFHTIRLAEESLLAEYQSEQTQSWPKAFTDPKNRWYGFALRGRVIAYHTERVPAEQAPRSIEDLLNPKWKGRLVMADPGFGTTGGDVASWFVHYGAERAHQILDAFKTNQVRLVDGNSTAVRMVATGQADVCLTDTDDVYAAQRNRWPVAMNFLDQNGDGALAIPNTAALIKNGPHPPAAKKLMEFLLSEELEEMLVSSDSHNAPLHPRIVERHPGYEIPHPLKIDYNQVADQLPIAIQSAREKLR